MKTEARHVPGLKLHQHVDIAPGTKVVPQNGAEERQSADVIAPAEFSELPFRNGGFHRPRI